MTETPQWLTTDDVMAALGVSRRTVERYRKGNPPRLPTYRTPGGRARFRPDDVAKLHPQPDTQTLETPAP
jgi:predicted site-specific integrase-resolvase